MNTQLTFFLNLAHVQAKVTRKFDGGLDGISLSEFMILLQLSQNPDNKLRRIDLAEKIGLTASGVTRLLATMEKIGLVKREANVRDARVSYIALASGGKRKLEEAMERAELISMDLIPTVNAKKLREFSEILSAVAGSIR